MRLSCILGVLLLSPSAAGQTPLQGILRDSSGLPLPKIEVKLQSPDSTVHEKSITDIDGKFYFSALPAGAYSLEAQPAGFFPIRYEFVLRARQPLSITLEAQRKQSLSQSAEVKARYLTVDPEKTSSSYTFTHRELAALPDPLTDSTNDLVTNLMPGASDSHDNFLAVRGTEFSLYEFINGVSFLDNVQPQFSPGISPQIFETVDLMTGGFTPEYGNRFGGVLDIITRSGADLASYFRKIAASSRVSTVSTGRISTSTFIRE
jgi:hypothetical protein